MLKYISFQVFIFCYCLLVFVFSDDCTTTFERIPDFTLPVHLLDDSEVYERLSPSECYHLCFNNARCGGYLLHHVIGRCVLVKVKPDDFQSHLVPDKLWSYYRKICLAGNVCKRHWSFERSAGVQLYGYEDKVIRHVETEDRCIHHCISENSFMCRSARYDTWNKTCVLSRHDRRTAPEAFRKSRHNTYYLENQCISEPSECSFIGRNNLVVVHRHVHVDNNVRTVKDCETTCLNHTDFICRSYSFDAKSLICLMTPEDSFSAKDDLGTISEGQTIYERGSCIEVEMKCEATTMTAIVKVITPFRGRVYALGHPYECYTVSVSSNGEIALEMPLHGRKCGTKNLGNGTFSNSVVVQHHPFVLRTTDRRINVACDYEEVQRKLRGGKQVLEGDLQSLTQVITGLAPTPPIKLRVVNSSGEEVKGVELGDPLYLKVEMMDESVFGIFGSGLVARSGQGADEFLLIDDRGCPLEPTVFPALVKEKDSKSLLGKFQAFKFASDPTLKFQLTVSFCLDICTPVDCNNQLPDGDFHQSYGRKKRSFDAINFDLQTGDVVTDVTMESAAFVVKNLKSTQTNNEWNRLTSTDIENETSRIRANTNKELCFTRPIFYTAATIASTLQLILVSSCIALLMKRRCRTCCYQNRLGSSRESVSSRTGLYGKS